MRPNSSTTARKIGDIAVAGDSAVTTTARRRGPDTPSPALRALGAAFSQHKSGPVPGELSRHAFAEAGRGEAPVDELAVGCLDGTYFMEVRPDIDELGLNPILARSDGAVAVDTRITITTQPALFGRSTMTAPLVRAELVTGGYENLRGIRSP
ncbi:MAG TPA: hypothetical protein VEL28_03935 [Candidatus Binatia bacterium]|nr:hypothetical protein [Candidatus Binatia bacterium]